jgi:predicted metal-binding membrane protein
LGTEARIQLRGGSATAIAALLALAAVAWVVTVVRMAGMDAGPGTDPGTLGFFITTWTVMMVAMMLPSAAPWLLVGRATPAMATGYVGVWALSGLVAYGVLEAGRAVAPGFFAWHHAGRWVAVAVLALAAAYELTAFKRACLARCRRRLLRADGALLAGAREGAWCVACCSGLMVALFALGSMSLVWMVVVSAAIAAQKLLARPLASTVAAAALLAALALGIALSPASVPGLTVPGTPMAMHMMRG